MKGQASGPKGLKKRVRNIRFEMVTEPRQLTKVRYRLPVVLGALLSAMVTRARSLRMVEQRSGQMALRHGQWLGLQQRVADNTMGKLIPRLSIRELVAGLHRQVKAEHRRGNLKPTRLALGTVAIDGKNVATLRWHELCRVLELDPVTTQPAQLKALLAERFAAVQLCVPEQGQPYALARVHTVTLVSSEAALCVHQRPILGCTNEVGSMPALLEELHTAYGRTRLIGLVTTDAGNTSLKAASQVIEYGWDYFCQIKSEHKELHAEAKRVLGRKGAKDAQWSESDQQNGKLVTYRVWCHDLTEQGWLDWTHARQLVRVQRIVEDTKTGAISEGNRYYVTSRGPTALVPKSCLKLSRGHWRCEDETHWTADAILGEDRRRLAWSRHPSGVFVVSLLRMMALNILAVARKLSSMHHANHELPSWRQVAEHFLLVLCGSTLRMEAFDAEI